MAPNVVTTEPAVLAISETGEAGGHPAPTLAQRPLRPFIKWAGGKTRLLKRLLPHVPESFNAYHEPFLGGGAMYFAIRDRAAAAAHLSDLNEDLINAWLAIRDHHDELQGLLRWYKDSDSKEFYYEQRPLQPTDPVQRGARFIYLNQTSWNGLWRVNRWGGFNVPWGQRPFRGLTPEDLVAYKEALLQSEVRLLDFREALDRPQRGDFVYLDPPYLPLSDTSKFHLYTERRFREPDLRELAVLCEALSMRGVSWMLSNRDTPLVRDLFDHARIIGLTARRSVAAQNVRDVEAVESPEVIVVGRGDLR